MASLRAREVVKRASMVAISVAYAATRTIWRFVLHRVLRRMTQPRVVVLTYHAVPNEDVARFKEQMRDLTTLTTAVFADESRETVDGRPAAAVTFDDALQSVFDQALPIMAEYRIPATIFVPTGFLGAAPGWIPAARRNSGSSGVLASAATLEALDHRWVRLGSHTVTHPYLASIPSTSVLEELAGSKKALEAITGGAVTMLSFPYGSFSAKVLEVARSAGYTHLFANVPLRADDGRVVQLLGRVPVTPRDWRLEFRLKVQGAYEWLTLAIPLKRAVLGMIEGRQES